MAYEMKPDTGSLFRNDKREKDSQPSAKGQALIDGVEYWISSWTNETKGGEKYQSLKFERKEARNERVPMASEQSGSYGNARRPSDDDFVPF